MEAASARFWVTSRPDLEVNHRGQPREWLAAAECYPLGSAQADDGGLFFQRRALQPMHKHPEPAGHLDSPATYDRQRDLPRLLPLTARQVSSGVLADRLAVIALLVQALGRERARAAMGVWSHDVSRHRLLTSALRRELARRGEGATDQP